MLPLADQVVELRAPFRRRVDRDRTRSSSPQARRSSAKATAATSSTSSRRAPSRSCAKRADGREDLLATLGPASYFGEMGPLFGLPRSATARATEPTVVTGYSVKDFRDKLGIERLGDIVSVAKTRV